VGLKVTRDAGAARRFGLCKVAGSSGDDLVLTPRGVVCWGGNSGMQAVNLALGFRARRLALVGFDMRVDLGLHWHGRHGGGLLNPNARATARWRERLDRQAPRLAAAGIEIINCSPVSALTAYPVMGLAEALRHFGVGERHHGPAADRGADAATAAA